MVKTTVGQTAPAAVHHNVQFNRVADNLVAFFLQENPPADFVEIVPDSIRAIDAKFGLYKALVRTDVYLGGVKQHVSNIRFKINQSSTVLTNTITFYEQQ